MTERHSRLSLAARLERGAERLIGAQVATGVIPHVRMLVSVAGENVLDVCAGAARAGGDALAPGALFRIASMSKPIAVVAFLALVERGLVALDTPVADIVPEMAAPRVWTGEAPSGGPLPTRPARRTMRMLDLLRHTSGLSYGFHRRTPVDALYEAADLDDYHRRRTSTDYAAALATMPLAFEPGEGFCYSLSIDLLGIAMERLTGEPLDSLLRSLVLDPLGMADTGFRLTPERMARLTDAWQVGPDGARTLYDRGERSRWRLPRKSWSAGGGLLSSAEDYHRFLRMLAGGGMLEGRRILSPESVVRMLRNQLPSGGDLEREGCFPLSETGTKGIGMGLGGAVLLDPPAAGEKGAAGCYFWGGILSTGFFLDPARQLIGIVMTQLLPSSATRLREDFRAMVEGAWEG